MLPLSIEDNIKLQTIEKLIEARLKIKEFDFFLDSAIKQGDRYLGKLKAIDEYYSRVITFASDNNIHINYIDVMFEKIVFTSKDFQGRVDASYNTINKNINKKSNQTNF